MKVIFKFINANGQGTMQIHNVGFEDEQAIMMTPGVNNAHRPFFSPTYRTADFCFEVGYNREQGIIDVVDNIRACRVFGSFVNTLDMDITS